MCTFTGQATEAHAILANSAQKLSLYRLDSTDKKLPDFGRGDTIFMKHSKNFGPQKNCSSPRTAHCDVDAVLHISL